MEFNEKLQVLRKQKELTQEQLAEILFVSRTAVSKWESGRGLPSIESLKSIAKVFGITIDELLSADEIILAAEKEKHENAVCLRSVLYGLFDLMNLIVFFVPLFGDRNGAVVDTVSMFSLKSVENYTLTAYIIITGVCVLLGVTELVLQNFENVFWKKIMLIFRCPSQLLLQLFL